RFPASAACCAAVAVTFPISQSGISERERATRCGVRQACRLRLITVHPSTVQVLDDIRLKKEFVALLHTEVRQLKLPTGRGSLEVDFSKIGAHYPFSDFVPQLDSL